MDIHIKINFNSTTKHTNMIHTMNGISKCGWLNLREKKWLCEPELGKNIFIKQGSNHKI